VDDDEAVNFINVMILKRTGSAEQIDIAENGMEAIQYLEERLKAGDPVPDLILLDINMPLLNGWEFLEKYRHLKAKMCQTPIIIMLTTSSNPDDRLRAEQIEEVQGFIGKPLSVEKMERIVTLHRREN